MIDPWTYDLAGFDGPSPDEWTWEDDLTDDVIGPDDEWLAASP